MLPGKEKIYKEVNMEGLIFFSKFWGLNPEIGRELNQRTIHVYTHQRSHFSQNLWVFN